MFILVFIAVTAIIFKKSIYKVQAINFNKSPRIISEDLLFIVKSYDLII